MRLEDFDGVDDRMTTTTARMLTEPEPLPLFVQYRDGRIEHLRVFGEPRRSWRWLWLRKQPPIVFEFHD